MLNAPYADLMFDYYKWSKYGSKEMTVKMSRKGENIRKRKDGRWEGRYLVYSEEKRKKIFRSVYGKTYTEAKEKLIKARIDELMPQPGNMPKTRRYTAKNYTSFASLATDWFDGIRLIKKHSTYIKYLNVYNQYLAETIGNYDITEITDELIRHEVMAVGDTELSESIERSIYCVINQIFVHAKTAHNIEVDKPVRRKSVRSIKPVKILSEKEQLDLLNVLYTDLDIYKLGVILCIFTGLRLGEICSLKWSDIDFETKILHVSRTVQRIAIKDENDTVHTALFEDDPKSLHSNRYIPLPDALYGLICQYKTDKEYFFNDDKPLEPRTYQNKFQKYLKEAGISNKNFHALRHTFATNLVTTGADVKLLSEIMGHANVQITLNRYVHPSMDNKRSQLDSLFSIRGQNTGHSE